jgi:hypothetical protein
MWEELGAVWSNWWKQAEGYPKRSDSMSESAAITFSIQYTSEDYAHASVLFNRTPPTAGTGKLSWLRYVILIIIVGLTISWTISHRSNPHLHASRISDNTVWNVLSVVVMAALFIGYWTFIMHRARKKTVVGEQETQVMMIGEEGIVVQSPTFETRMLWTRWTQALEDQHLFLLTAGNIVHLIPKRVITNSDDVLLLRALIERKVGTILSGEAPKSTTLPPPPARGAEQRLSAE